MPISERENIFPSGANLVAIKARLNSARKGLSMLIHKRDAIEIKVRGLKQQLEMLDLMKKEALQEGLMHMARARYYGTKFEPYLVAQTKFAETYLLNQTTRVVGINIPMFEFKTEPKNQYRFAGLSGGAEEARNARSKFLELLELLISIASIKFSLIALEPALQQTKTRCNAVEYVVIPKLEATVNYILEALDEQEREDFYRLKCSKAKQTKRRQNQYRKYAADGNLHMDDFFGDNEILQPERLQSIARESIAESSHQETTYKLEEKRYSIEIQPATAPKQMPQRKSSLEEYSSKEIQTDSVDEPFESQKAHTRTVETQTDELPTVAPDPPLHIRKKSYELDNTELTKNSALSPEDEFGSRRRKRLKRISKDWKTSQTDE